MKKTFFDLTYDIMQKNKDVYMLFCGLGYPRVKQFIKEFPERAFNIEASEQTALDISVGLAYEDKIPFVYTITPFLLRGFETIRTYINHENLNVKLIGAGRDDDYSKHDGFSHEAGDIGEILDTMHNIEQYYPENENELKITLDLMVLKSGPMFLSLKR